ncbi:WXG100 family type VII secretion target [Paenibacillus tarimensis]|uniref:WXG100 family type VII secretion target n=1 Tax=Paenibacillus tarimensis TaxID=416012 RepID=UPI001F4513E4|nr:WXG100 family type VII secretion target [Paenibacillus tarimensis]MCF2942878.1 WXG100 family type VII secretion target [Paenibacillus tarimensis]
MGINVGLASSQAGQLRQQASELSASLNNLAQFKAQLGQGWKAEEVAYINQAIDSIHKEITQLAAALNSLGGDIVQTAQEIREEELRREAEARAAAEAAAKAAAKARAAK